MKKYIELEIKVSSFAVEDIVRTSDGNDAIRDAFGEMDNANIFIE